MNYVDLFAVVVALYFTVMGAKRGFIKELLAIVGLILAIALCYFFGPEAVNIAHEYFNNDWVQPIVYALLFVITLLTIRLIANALTKLSKYVALGFVNRFFGAVFGLSKALTLLFIALYGFLFLQEFFSFSTPAVVESSMAAELFENVLNQFSGPI